MGYLFLGVSRHHNHISACLASYRSSFVVRGSDVTLLTRLICGRFARKDEHQLQAELDWACQRPSTRWTEDTPCRVSAANAFEDALTEGEYGFLRGYEERIPDGIYCLNQRPDLMCVGTNQPAASLRTAAVVLCVYSCVVCVFFDLLIKVKAKPQLPLDLGDANIDFVCVHVVFTTSSAMVGSQGVANAAGVSRAFDILIQQSMLQFR